MNKLKKDLKKFYEEETMIQKSMYRPDSYAHNQIKKFVMRHIVKNKPNTLLDVGCAEGDYVCFAQAQGSNAIGLDFSRSKLKIAINSNKLLSGRLIEGDAEYLPFKKNAFDLVIALEVLEHVLDYDKALKELFRVSKKQVIISIPCKKSVGAGHIHYFYPKEIKNWTEFGNLKIKGVLIHTFPFRQTLMKRFKRIREFVNILDNILGSLPLLRFSGTHVILVFNKSDKH